MTEKTNNNISLRYYSPQKPLGSGLEDRSVDPHLEVPSVDGGCPYGRTKKSPQGVSQPVKVADQDRKNDFQKEIGDWKHRSKKKKQKGAQCPKR